MTLSTAKFDVEHSALNSLRYDPAECVNCNRCVEVCPHAVFEEGAEVVTLAAADDCMECGACMRNCPADAIFVDSGVGCAGAMIRAALTGKEEACCG